MSAADVVAELARLFAAGDTAAAFALYADDIAIEQPASLPHGGVHVGMAGLQAMSGAFSTHWDRSITPVSLWGTDVEAVQVTTQTWTSKATGRAATVDVVELLSVAGGKVTRIRVFQQDTAALLATLG